MAAALDAMRLSQERAADALHNARQEPQDNKPQDNTGGRKEGQGDLDGPLVNSFPTGGTSHSVCLF